MLSCVQLEFCSLLAPSRSLILGRDTLTSCFDHLCLLISRRKNITFYWWICKSVPDSSIQQLPDNDDRSAWSCECRAKYVVVVHQSRKKCCMSGDRQASRSDPVCVVRTRRVWGECDPNGITLPSKGSIHELEMTLIGEAPETERHS